MELSIFLAKLIGVYALIGSLAALMNRDHFRKAAVYIYKNYALLMVIAAIELLGGLALVLNHNIWTGWLMVITIIGWAMIFEGIFFLFSPESFRSIRKKIMKKNVYYSYGLFGLALGGYLVYYGFFALA